nr:uncharacterized protein LOC115260977 [Aedes albopictus]
MKRKEIRKIEAKPSERQDLRHNVESNDLKRSLVEDDIARCPFLAGRYCVCVGNLQDPEMEVQLDPERGAGVDLQGKQSAAVTKVDQLAILSDASVFPKPETFECSIEAKSSEMQDNTGLEVLDLH